MPKVAQTLTNEREQTLKKFDFRVDPNSSNTEMMFDQACREFQCLVKFFPFEQLRRDGRNETYFPGALDLLS